MMGCVQLLLLGSLWSLFVVSSMGRSVPGDLPDEEVLQGTAESTFREICEGMEEELRKCNDLLLDKAEYTSKIEKDLFNLKRHLRDVRVTCKDAAHASVVQISALQTQLDGLLKQLGEKATGPAKDVLNILQKYVDIKKLEMNITMETNPTKISESGERLKKAKAELNKMTGSLSQSTCPAANASQLTEIRKLQEEIDKLRTGSDGSTQSSRVTELQKQLEKKLKDLEKTDRASKPVSEIIRHQEEALDLQKRLADLLKAEAEKDALQRELTEKKAQLADLKEKKEEKGEDKKLDNQIAAVEGDVVALQDKLQTLNRTLSQEKELKKRLSEKKKQIEDKANGLKNTDQDLVSKILSAQFELQQARIQAHGEKKVAEVQIADLKKQLSQTQDRVQEVLAKNEDLKNRLTDQTMECDDLQESYNKMSDQVENLINNIPDSSLKPILEIVSLNIDIDNIRNSIASEKSKPKIKALENELKQKINQVDSQKGELKKKDPNAEQILKIIQKMEEIQKLQSEAVKVESLDQINALQKNLLKMIDALSDSNPAKLALKNMAVTSDVSWVKKLITSITQQVQDRIAALEEQVKTKEELLNNKTTDLAKKGSDVGRLTKEILALREEVKKLKGEKKNLELSSAAQVKDLNRHLDQSRKELDKVNESLSKKDAELAKKVNKITQLMEDLKQTKEKAHEKEQETTAKINDLEKKLQKSETEKSEVDAQNKKLQQDLEEAKKCTELQKSYDELQAQFSKEVGQLNNSLAGQVLTIQTLSVEVEAIEKKLNKSEGNAGALKAELQKKKSALEKVTKDLKKTRADSAEFMKLMESMRKLSRKQEQSISDYLAEIDRLEKETEALMTKLGARGDEKSQLTIQVITLKAQLANLEKLQEELKQEAEEKTKEMKKYIEERNKEIAYLKKSGCGGDQMKNRIAKLEAEVKAKQKELDKLKDSSDAEVNKLQKKITETAQKLDKSGDKLKQKDEQNVELIKRLAGLEEQLRQATSGRDSYKQTAQKQIDDLKKEVKDKEKEASTLKSSTADLKKQLRNYQENIADLKKSNAALKGELDRKQEALTKAQKEVKNKETSIASLKEQLQKKAEEAKEQGKCEGVVEENGRLREQLTEVHARMKKLQEASRENRELKEKLKAANDKVKELENTGSGDARIAVASPELDPDTAHPRLLLSHNGQTVRASEFSRYVPNNPGRYDSALAAVGKTGYITGRHFWEVQVQNRACFVVGVAKESAQRKGLIKYGPSKGYWGILKRKDGRYQVLTDKPIDLVSDKLTTIGVLVDISKGEISFYNAKLKKLLYTFSGNAFEERLYPYIETCTDQSKNEPPIVISKPQSILWLELK